MGSASILQGILFATPFLSRKKTQIRFRSPLSCSAILTIHVEWKLREKKNFLGYSAFNELVHVQTNGLDVYIPFEIKQLMWNEEEVRRMALAMAIGLLIWEGKLRIESLFQP